MPKTKKSSYYKVQRVLDQRMNGTICQYLVKWQGYSQVTWQPLSYLLNAMIEVIRFERERQERVGGKRGGGVQGVQGVQGVHRAETEQEGGERMTRLRQKINNGSREEGESKVVDLEIM